jgi:cytochrome P450
MRARGRISRKLLQIIQGNRQSSTTTNKELTKELTSMTLLTRLINTKDDVNNEYLSPEEIIDNIFTLIFAGSDTTASVLTSAMKALSIQPSLIELLRDTDVNDTRIEYFLLEIMSRNPPAPFSMRLVGDEPLVLKNGYTVPSNWLVAYGYAGTLLDESNESSFYSQDFIGKLQGIKTENFLAFGGGLRMCPGRYLALTELKLMLKQLLSSSNGLRWKLEEGQNLNQTYTPGYFPIDGLKIKVEV